MRVAVFADDLHPIRHRPAPERFCEAGRQCSRLVEIFDVALVDEVLLSDLLCRQLALADPTADRLRVLAEPLRRFENRQVTQCSVLQHLREARPHAAAIAASDRSGGSTMARRRSSLNGLIHWSWSRPAGPKRRPSIEPAVAPNESVSLPWLTCRQMPFAGVVREAQRVEQRADLLGDQAVDRLGAARHEGTVRRPPIVGGGDVVDRLAHHVGEARPLRYVREREARQVVPRVDERRGGEQRGDPHRRVHAGADVGGRRVAPRELRGQGRPAERGPRVHVDAE